MRAAYLGLAGFGQKIQGIAFLLAQGDDSGQNALDEKRASFTLGAEAAATPDDRPPQGAFGGIVGRLDACLADEGPQSRFQGEDVASRSLIPNRPPR